MSCLKNWFFRLQRNWGERSLQEFKKLAIKLKFGDFTQTTLERTTDGLSRERFIELLQQVWQRTNRRSVRLIGLSVHYPTEKVKKQLNLWE
ncbi:DNA polymerase IV [Actinobacillus pleuropneumoniae]|nr:DNA polymerase IV [Actinobacillus pleuropneumoniae]